MKTIQTFLISSICLLTLHAADPSLIVFSGSINAAREKACREKKVLLLEFTAKWCEPCRMMDRDVFSNPKVQEYIQKNAILYKVDIDIPANRRLKEEYRISVLPTTILMRASGKILSKKEQTFNPESFISWIDEGKQSAPMMVQNDRNLQEDEPVTMELPSKEEFELYSDPSGQIQDLSEIDKKQNESSLTGFSATIFVQSGVYSNKQNAEAQAVKLLALYKQDVRIAEEIHPGKKLYKVYIGHFESREEAEILANQMHKDRFEAVVKRY